MRFNPRPINTTNMTLTAEACPNYAAFLSQAGITCAAVLSGNLILIKYI